MNTRKLVIELVVYNPFLSNTGRVIALKGCIASSKNPFNGVGNDRSFLGSMLIVANTSQKRMYVELPLSNKILLMV